MRNLPSFILLLAASVAYSQDISALETNSFRPFRAIVESFASQPVQRQYDYFLRLSEGLMTEDYARFTGQTNVAHFGHLVDELRRQQMLPVLRVLMQRGKLNPYHHWAISERLGRELDPETFGILVLLAEKDIAKSVTVSGEDIDALSVVSMGHYLHSTNYHARAESELLKLLSQHGHPSVRGFAAEALQACTNSTVILALEKATKDSGSILTPQGPYSKVSEYAEESLAKIRKGL